MCAAEQKSRLGDFELLAKLGEGGMGAVFKARQISLDRIVALKVLPRRLAADQQYIERFVREARATAKLNHPNIIAGIDVNCVDGYYYFAMEYVEGVTLKARIQSEGPLPEVEVLRIGEATASALAHAHSFGIVHRDVKPDNILLDRDGTPKLADLGLAKGTAHEDGTLTQAGVALGTPHYMAPEQARGEANIDGRADTYALGCTLYHAATGRTPFEGNTTAVLMVKHINEKMPHPQSLRPTLSDNFCSVLSCMVARNAEDRYADLQEAAADMEAVRLGQSIQYGLLPAHLSNFLPNPVRQGTKRVRPIGAERSPTASHTPVGAAVAVRPSGTSTRFLRAQKKSWRPLALACAGAVVALAGLVAFFSSPGARPPEAPAPPAAEVAEVKPAAPAPGPKTDQAPPPVAAANPKAAPPSETPKAPATETRSPGEASVPVVPAGEGPKAAPPTERVVTKPATPPAEGIPLFNGRDLGDWKIVKPNWTVEDGALVGQALEKTNATLARYRLLPKDFDLTMTVNAAQRFHVGFTGRSGGAEYTLFMHKHLEGTLDLTRADSAGEKELARSAAKASPGSHIYRLLVWQNTIRVYLDGQLALKAETDAGDIDKRDVYLSAGTAPTQFRELVVRDMSLLALAVKQAAPAQPAATPAFNGRDLEGWKLAAPQWQFADGAVIGKGLQGNASLQRYRLLPAEFELTFEAETSGRFHFGWSAVRGTLSNYVHRDDNGVLRISSYRTQPNEDARSEDLAQAGSRLAAGSHAYRVVVRKNTIQVFVDGALMASADNAESSDNLRDLFLYSASGNETRFRRMAYRDLAGVAETDVATAENTSTNSKLQEERAAEVLKLLELKPEAEALGAFGSFMASFLGLLRKMDTKAAAERLAQAEKDPALKAVADALKDCRRLLGWFADFERAEVEGAKKLKDIDDFEIQLTRGDPLHVGKRAKFQVTNVANGALEISSGGLTLPRPINQLAPETRAKLAEMGLATDGAGMVRRAYFASAGLKVPPDPKALAAVRATLKKAKDAGAAADEVELLERWLKAIEEGLDNIAAAVVWDKLRPMAAARQWKPLHQALVTFVTNYATTPLYDLKRQDVDALLNLCNEAQTGSRPSSPPAE